MIGNAEPSQTPAPNASMITPRILAVRIPICWYLLVLALFTIASSSFAYADQPSDRAEADELFVRRIWPLINERCLACHGAQPDDLQGGLDLRSHLGLSTGGDSGQAAIDRENLLASPFLAAVTDGGDGWSVMPPKESERLNAEQVGWVRDWIAAGAPWPSEAEMDAIAKAATDRWAAEDGILVKTSGGQSKSWTNRRYRPESLWAYQSVVRPSIDETGSAAIDRLIEDRLPAELSVAPPADRLTLIRRATFDLTGLPPTPNQVADFLSDPLDDDQAFANLVDRLLDSPHYGERMAQHWLDVVRYADSSGLANDYQRGNAWRYRDYVIRSFNDDKPYNHFIAQQIAGDEIDPNDPEMLVATGFLRMGPWELTSMEVAKVARQRFLDDVTNGVGETFLSHSLQCARCHDHKFDPVSTGDYYAIQAVFATTQLAERAAPFFASENTNGFERRRYLLAQQQQHQQTLARLDEQLLVSAQQWFDENGIDAAKWNDAVKRSATSAGSVFNAARSVMAKLGITEDQYPPKFYGFTVEDYGHDRVARKGLERLSWELDRYEPFALSVYNGKTPDVKSVNRPVRIPKDPMASGELEKSSVLVGGDPFSPGQPVAPGVLSVLCQDEHYPIPTTIDGRRKALADWIASADNPLTTRSIVNRVWMWHFGDAIAANPNNFGSTGATPTHPELLDFLAASLVENNWSIKSLHRMIMTSKTYRRGGKHPSVEDLRKADPLGTSYAVFKPRRLTAEEIRDAMLVATGELNRDLGGIPNCPEINLEAALQPRQVMGTFATAWVPDPLPQQRHRRSIYALKLRGLVDPSLEVFNTPSPDFSCERRQSSTVTPQALTLFNGHTSHQRALALAIDVLKQGGTKEEAIHRIFQRTLSRPPTAEESSACVNHWDERLPMVTEPHQVPTPPKEVRRDAIEENTGERFSFVERLYAYDDFVPDLSGEVITAEARALADICLVLFNTNEFVYVY